MAAHDSGWSARSASFELFHRAILGRQQIVCVYGGYPRVVCPYILGRTAGREVALVYQFGGTSSRGLRTGGDWRCFYLDGVEQLQLREGPWYGGAPHRTRQQCVDDVFVDVNLDVPNQPGRQG
jgi:hypothetical protein